MKGVTSVTPFLFTCASGQLRVRRSATPRGPAAIDRQSQFDRATKYAQAGQAHEAIRELRMVLGRVPGNAAAHLEMGRLYLAIGNPQAAECAYRQALSLQPDSPQAQLMLAALLASSGRSDEAAAGYRLLIDESPANGHAHYGLSMLRPFAVQRQDEKRMLAAIEFPGIADRDRLMIEFALGRTCDTKGEYERAFRYFSAANRRQSNATDWSLDRQAQMLDRHRQALGASFQAHCRNDAVNDDSVIFVMGMPRSGTSLAEQILASHADVYGAGEVEHFLNIQAEIQKLTGDQFPLGIEDIAPGKLAGFANMYVRRLKQASGKALRVIDKLPHNFLRVGFFAATMPQAKFIVCRRNPLDNCISIFQHYFADDHGYATNLEDLGRYYNLQDALIDAWKKLLPGRLFFLDYELLVDDFDAQVRSLLAYCNLAFDADCLAFHENRRISHTPSSQQIREPLNRNSVGRASNYECHLEPLIAALNAKP